jgi:hypothetical protein
MTNQRHYALSGHRLDVRLGGPLIWRSGGRLGPSQEGFVTLTKVDPRGREQGLLLKVGGDNAPDWRLGAIKVVYDALRGEVGVATFRMQAGQASWLGYHGITAEFQNGDQLGARALANGEVWVYRNGALAGAVLVSAAEHSYAAGQGGRIGLWFVGASQAVLGSFGGGAVAL